MVLVQRRARHLHNRGAAARREMADVGVVPALEGDDAGDVRDGAFLQANNRGQVGIERKVPLELRDVDRRGLEGDDDARRPDDGRGNQAEIPDVAADVEQHVARSERNSASACSLAGSKLPR